MSTHAEEFLLGSLKESGIPEYMHEGLVLYISRGIPGGGFLDAVLCGSLREAVWRADVRNKHSLVAYVEWLSEYAPASCWGSPERVDSWMAKRGLDGEGR